MYDYLIAFKFFEVGKNKEDCSLYLYFGPGICAAGQATLQ